MRIPLLDSLRICDEFLRNVPEKLPASEVSWLKSFASMPGTIYVHHVCLPQTAPGQLSQLR